MGSMRTAYRRLKSGFGKTFRSLRYRNFRLFFIGQGLSLVGTWMAQVAMSWLVYRLTGSSFKLGLVVFASQIPTFFLGPLAGAVIDRRPKLRMLLFTQSFAMLQAFALTVLTYSREIQVWQIMVLAVFGGCVNAFDIPCRQSFLVDLIEEKNNLSNAISLNSLMFNSARLIGPALAGIVLAYTSEAACFLLNALSFVAVLVSLLMMKVHEHLHQAESRACLKASAKAGTTPSAPFPSGCCCSPFACST